MKLLSESLRNFKGIKNFTLDTQGGCNVDILGDNATGKTSIYDGFVWLLFDKDSNNRKDFEIKTLSAQGEALHGLEHAVEGVFDLGPKNITLAKVYSEQWTRKRGSAEKTFTGHTSEYFVDSVPVKKNEYEKIIAQIIDEDKFRLLTNPAYFNEHLSWQERRKKLLDVCGDLTDAEVIASDASLSKLPKILNGRALDDHKKVIATRRAKINDELKKIPIRIDEAQRALPDINDISCSQLQTDIESLKGQIQEKQQELTRIESGGGIAEKQIRLRQIEGELLQIKNEVGGKTSEQIMVKNRELNQLNTDIVKAESEVGGKQSALDSKQRMLKQAEENIEKARSSWYEVDRRQLDYVPSENCPTCGQHLPEDQIEAAHKKALTKFNQVKSSELENITNEGKDLANKKDVLVNEIQTLTADIETLSAELPRMYDQATGLLILIEKLNKDSNVYVEYPAYIAKLNEKRAVEDAIAQLQQDNSQAKAEVIDVLNDLDASLQYFQSQLAKIDQVEQGNARIKELEEQEKELAAEYEKLEGELYLAEQFTRAKVKLMDEKISSKFRLAHFKMFNVLVNGGLEDCCETTYNGVPYSSLNAGHKIIVGLDIIRTLSEYYNFTAPIFVDNAESVTALPEMDAQIIRLIKPEITPENKKEYSQLVVRVEGQEEPNLFKEAM